MEDDFSNDDNDGGDVLVKKESDNEMGDRETTSYTSPKREGIEDRETILYASPRRESEDEIGEKTYKEPKRETQTETEKQATINNQTEKKEQMLIDNEEKREGAHSENHLMKQVKIKNEFLNKAEKKKKKGEKK